MLARPKSIDDYGGIRLYLDDPKVRHLHNGYGYDDLVKNRHRGPAFIRDLFNLKSRATAYRWFDRLDRETQKNGS